MQKYQLAAKEAHESLTDEITDKLAKVEAKSKSKTEQLASLVSMVRRITFVTEETYLCDEVYAVSYTHLFKRDNCTEPY